MRKHTYYRTFAVLLILLMAVASFAHASELEKELHFKAWQEIAEKAATVPQYKYALYASRSLAVKHPELYLQGDALFDKLLVSLPNMSLYYTTRNKNIYALEEELVRPFFSLPDLRETRFNWSTFDLNRHQEISYASLYKDALQFPFLDLRLPPLGVSLLGWDFKATPLAMAQMLYFQQRANKDVRSAYLLVAEGGQAYVASFDRKGNARLFNHLGAETERTENIILIFNDKRVWYPLMERDDTGRDKNLRNLVSAYASDNPLPHLTAEEEQLVGLLRDGTAQGTSKDKRWMLVIASRLHARSWYELNELQKLYPRWASIRASHGPDIFTTELAYIHRLSNKLSPATSFLAAYALDTYGSYTAPYYDGRLNHTIDFLSRRYNSYMGVSVVLFPWWYHSELHFLNIDDSVFSKRANCIMISTNLAGILDVAQLPDVTTYQVYIPGHVIVLMTAAEGYYSVLDNNRFVPPSWNYTPSTVRALGLEDGWIRLQDRPQPYNLKDVYASFEPGATELFIRTTLKDLSRLYPYSKLTIAKPGKDDTLNPQSYEEFVEQIDKRKIKIRQWK